MNPLLPNRLVDRIPVWSRYGACLDYPDEDGFFVSTHTPEASEEVKRICAGCPVRQQCLDYALERPEQTGDAVYGGLTPEQRRQLTRMRSFVRCPGCGGRNIMEVPRGEVCLGCGVSWLT